MYLQTLERDFLLDDSVSLRARANIGWSSANARNLYILLENDSTTNTISLTIQ